MPPRMRRVMFYQLIAVVLNAFLVAGLSLMLIDWINPSLVAEGGFANLAMRWVAMLCMTIIGCRWLNNISLMIINMVVYGGDLEAAAQDAEDAIAGSLALPEEFGQSVPPRNGVLEDFIIVNKPETAYARYQDADIFEWLDIKDESGLVHRALFAGTVDLKQGIPQNLTAGTILLPPGILYKFALPQ